MELTALVRAKEITESLAHKKEQLERWDNTNRIYDGHIRVGKKDSHETCIVEVTTEIFTTAKALTVIRLQTEIAALEKEFSEL